MQILSSPKYNDVFAALSAILDCVSTALFPAAYLAPTDSLVQCRAVVSFIQILSGLIVSVVWMVMPAYPVVVAGLEACSIDRTILRYINFLCVPNAKLCAIAPCLPTDKLSKGYVWTSILSVCWIVASIIL